MQTVFAELAAKSSTSNLNALRDAQVESLCSKNGLTIQQFYDQYATYVALEFLSGRMDFYLADSIANDIFGHSEHSLTGLAWEVFEAFDEGEYYHSTDSRAVDPMQKYTIPMLRKLFPEVPESRT